MSKINENIKNFREMRRLTQKRFSEMLNKSRNVISNWERGENSPDPDTIEEICKILNVTPNQIFGWEPCPDYERYVSQLNRLVDQENQINNEIIRLTNELLKIKTVRKKMMSEDSMSIMDLPIEEE